MLLPLLVATAPTINSTSDTAEAVNGTAAPDSLVAADGTCLLEGSVSSVTGANVVVQDGGPPLWQRERNLTNLNGFADMQVRLQTSWCALFVQHPCCLHLHCFLLLLLLQLTLRTRG